MVDTSNQSVPEMVIDIVRLTGISGIEMTYVSLVNLALTY